MQCGGGASQACVWAIVSGLAGNKKKREKSVGKMIKVGSRGSSR